MSLQQLASNLNLRDPNPIETLRLMTISLGELASHAEDNAKAVEKAVGNITLCCLYFCDLHGLDLEDAAYKAAEIERPRQVIPQLYNNNKGTSNPPFFKPARSENSSSSRLGNTSPLQQPPVPFATGGGASAADNVVLSPNTTSQFFEKLDDLAEKPRTVLDETALFWVVVLEDGTIREAFPGGRHTRVGREQFNEYYTWAQQFRHGYEPPSRVINVTAPGNYDDKQELMLYSPNHFETDIFSPHNPHDSLLVVRDRASSANGHDVDNATNPASSRSRVNSQSPAPQVHQDANRGPAEIAFWEKVEKLESQKLSPKEVADLKLTWQFPHTGNRLVQLTQNGNLVAVTEKNKRDFLDKLRHKLAELEGDSRGGPNGSGDVPNFSQQPRRKSLQLGTSFGRTASEKKLSVSNPQNPEGVQELFSPNHDDAGLFAPSVDADAHSTIRIDTNAPASSTLPRALVQDSPINPSRNASPHSSPLASSFSTKILDGDYFIAAMTAIHENPSSADRFGVTYCMPYPIDAPRGIKDLVPGGRGVRVPPSEVPRYLALLRDNM